MRSAAQGQLMMTNGCDELVKGEAFINGVWCFDANTGMSYVGSGAAQYVTDAFPCSDKDDPLFGLPLYGLDPGCRNSGDNPDREVGVIRPTESSVGTPYGHLIGPPNQGLPREITPVHLVPAALPSPAPADTFIWLCKEITSDGCISKRYQWYRATVAQALSTSSSGVVEFDLPEGPLTSAQDDDFGVAVWVYENGQFVLQKATNETLQRLFEFSRPATRWLDPGAVIFEQLSQGTFSEGKAVNLSSQPGYFAEATEVVLFLKLITHSPFDGGMIWTNSFFVDGRQVFQGAGQPAKSGLHATSQVTVPIPSTKIVNLNFIRDLVLTGALHPGNTNCYFSVTLQAFR